MKHLSSILLCGLTLFTGCTTSKDSTSPVTKTPLPSTSAQIATDYKNLIQITPQPVLVDSGLAMLCTGPTQSQHNQATKTSGPHANTAITIYMNPAAADAFTNSSKTYPAGSIIVKEKKSLGHYDNQHHWQLPPDGVGGMIKRPQDYDPDHGNWEYFYFENPTQIQSGKLSTCVQCHANAAPTDHVFAHWSRGLSARPTTTSSTGGQTAKRR